MKLDNKSRQNLRNPFNTPVSTLLLLISGKLIPLNPDGKLSLAFLIIRNICARKFKLFLELKLEVALFALQFIMCLKLFKLVPKQELFKSEPNVSLTSKIPK